MPDAKNCDLSTGVGTHAYMAPEVINETRYSSKVDIFSLGIIIVELWTGFSTGHERIVALMDCKLGKVPQSLIHNHPSAARLALACLQASPDKRPSAMEVCSHLKVEAWSPCIEYVQLKNDPWPPHATIYTIIQLVRVAPRCFLQAVTLHAFQ